MNRNDLIGELLRGEDIEGLLSMRAPKDEYELEAEMITDRIGETEEQAPDHRLTRGEVEKIIASVGRKCLSYPDEDAKQRQGAFTAIAARLVP